VGAGPRAVREQRHVNRNCCRTALGRAGTQTDRMDSSQEVPVELEQVRAIGTQDAQVDASLPPSSPHVLLVGDLLISPTQVPEHPDHRLVSTDMDPGAEHRLAIQVKAVAQPDDLRAAAACVKLCREIGNSRALRPYAKREVMPGNLRGAELENFVRDAASSTWHQTCTAKMGRDSQSVVDANLKVYGVKNLRIADGSIIATHNKRKHHGALSS
jgi:choline dehydrogenase-like flavoprotein